MRTKKRIYINASTVLVSGGLIVTQNIIKALIEDGGFQIYISCPNYFVYREFNTPNSKIKVVPKYLLKKYFRLFLDWVWLPNHIRSINPDLVLSLSNLPARTTFKQIFLHDNPYLTVPKHTEIPLSKKVRLTHLLRNSICKNRFKFVDLIVTQTEYQKQRLDLLISGKTPIKVISPGIPSDLIIPEKKRESLKGKYKLLCLSRYYEHKNIEILLKVALELKRKRLPFTIYLTLSTKHHYHVKGFLIKIKKLELQDYLINIGRIQHRNVGQKMKDFDAFILPTFLESFSLSFIEAWYFKKCLFTSNLESIKSACKDAAIYFNPHSVEDILEAITQTFSNESILESKIIEGQKRLKDLNPWGDYTPLIHSMTE